MKEARALLLAGDSRRLASMLVEDPDLPRRRFSDTSVPYDGYFHGATLLHHVAANPFIGDLPQNIEEMATLLLDSGADVDAITLQGPSQPDDIGWTTLGLVATSAAAREAGHQRSLMDLLIEAGADVDARNGGCIIGALYYGEADAAGYLAARGARLDLAAAAGVGDIARMEALLATADESLLKARLADYGLARWPETADRSDVLGVALVYAALHGRVEAMEILLQAGADPNGRPPFDHHGTALHWAVMGDQPDAVGVLLDAGADPEAVDRSFDSTPEGWARHLGKTRALEALARD
ncbi:MAG: ankyrin repeat domain-containing protein [Longimicrobiales bacterium]|nr:ankyrin repeat domain-containing protein [Longimicrobiales bacterium]